MRILLATDDLAAGAALAQALRVADYEPVTHAQGFERLLQAVQKSTPDAVILGVSAPSRELLTQLALLDRHAPLPVVMFAATGDEAQIRDALATGVASYVADGLSPTRVVPVLQVALARFAQQAQARQRLDALEARLQDRKDIERAKGLLMDRRGLAEAAAYAALRQQAMKQGLKLADVARRVLALADLLG